MASKIYMPEYMQHPGWTGQHPDTIQANGLQFADLDVGNWTVKLEFRVGGKVANGSGFLINVPDCPKAVILTAGHNLLGPDGARSTDLAVLEAPEAKYVMPEDDRLKDAKKDVGFGFGWSLRLGHAEHIKGTVYVSGYQGTTPSGHPITSSGPLVAAYADWLEYRPKTEQGISGSVVWTEYQGSPTVIAIYNSSADPKRKNGGSRGTRLTVAVLREVLCFAQVGHYNVRLRAHGTPKQVQLLPKRGLYMSFPEEFPFARVRLGPGGALDILPAEVNKKTKLHALAVRGQWALFNAPKQQITLSADVQEECLFSIDDKTKKGSDETAIEIVIARGDGKLQLRMRGEKLKDLEDDFEDEDAESSEVSMVKYPGKDVPARTAEA
ncbi:uncharacterized protein B0H18DRAFT_1125047 [Fomitopsis serialis]|uniref:uncharacterized protein n=1 Tax=Fomitopsis serialis TaxID=139415 RepID=UPI002007A4C4|nr:uncharacterized protein B0H18DRAFT_1125047 [Neoantrodia serialis]KAH9915135.1 hypothetical protein B0H18DRAFT_1125047 [Neoantrodia serialis]